MKKYNSFLDNELLTGISILRALYQVESLELSKVMLIDPLLSYKKIVKLLTDKRNKVRSIEELIVKSDFLLTGFNERFQEKLILSINAIHLLIQLKLVKIENNCLVKTNNNFNFNEYSLGKIAKKLIIASSELIEIIKKKEVSSLYLNLRIEL